MILRKPYAFLIKYFKLIHIIMFALFSYLVFALRKIYVFFSDYIKTSNFIYTEKITQTYVPWTLIVIVIILLGLAIGILLLMRKKEKPVLFYKIMIAYTVVLFAVLVYFMGFFKSLDDTTYEPLRIVANRDIILGVYIVNFFFVAFSFIRGFGFDIKKFSFEKDKKDLRLEESDSEEYELNVNLEKDDVKSFLNKNKRELIYYIKQNKTFLLIVIIVASLALVIYGYHTIFVVNKVYHEKDDIVVGNLSYRVNSSTISNVDKYGQKIGEKDDYLIINLNIVNNAKTGYLDEQAFRVHVDDNSYYYPSASLCDLFSDVGTCYKNQELVVNTNNDYILVYKIQKGYKDIELEILKDVRDEYHYNRVKLEYSKSEIKDLNYKVNEEFELNGNNYSINSYFVLDKASYQYQECVEEICNNFVKRVLPNTGDVVLTIEVSNLNTLSDDFIKSAFGIMYNNVVYSGKKIKLIDKYENFLYYSVPSFLKNVDRFTLLISTRKTKYNILLGDS